MDLNSTGLKKLLCEEISAWVDRLGKDEKERFLQGEMELMIGFSECELMIELLQH